MTIARSLMDGYKLYDFIPSKSWGLYYIIAAYFSLGNVMNHQGVSFLITSLFSLAVLLTLLVMKKYFTRGATLCGAFLIALCCCFMEMNFLMSEIFVYLCGLIGFYWICRFLSLRLRRYLVWGGLWFGFGSTFKIVAVFYLLGAMFFIAWWGHWKEKSSFIEIIKNELAVMSAFLIFIVAPAIYFAFLGRLREHLFWTYFFPFFRYPSDIFLFGRLLTKLLWWLALSLYVFTISLHKRTRREIYSTGPAILALFMGLVSSIALWKSRSPHFLFPGATFLSIFYAFVIDKNIREKIILDSRKPYYIKLVVALIFASTSIFLHCPGVLNKFITIRDYPTNEDKLTTIIQRYVPEGKRALFFNSSFDMYWLGHRYPNIPFIAADAKMAYALEKDPDLLCAALRDPNLMLVEFNPESTGAEEHFINRVANKVFVQFYKTLEQYFVIAPTTVDPYVFWIRK